jgi:hypothetical protein
MLLAGRGACIFGSRNAPPSVTRPLQGYARAKILAVRLSRDEMHASMFKATVYEIFRLGEPRYAAPHLAPERSGGTAAPR